MMEKEYSTLAAKYVGSTPALEALTVLRRLVADRKLVLDKGVAVTRSAGGELNYFPVRQDPLMQYMLSFSAAGLVLGYLLSRRTRWSVFLAALGGALARIVILVRKQELAAVVPYVEKNESMIYMEVVDADWPTFFAEMAVFLEQGKLVLCTIAPADEELERFLSHGGLVAGPNQTGTVRDKPASNDFTALRGIGPVTNERLHNGGVHTYAQMADMDVASIAQLTGMPVARIVNNDWLGQARAMARWK